MSHLICCKERDHRTIRPNLCSAVNFRSLSKYTGVFYIGYKVNKCNAVFQTVIWPSYILVTCNLIYEYKVYVYYVLQKLRSCPNLTSVTRIILPKNS